MQQESPTKYPIPGNVQGVSKRAERVLDIAKMVQMAPITLQQLQNYRAQNRMARPHHKSSELLRNCRPQLPAPKVNKRPQSTGKLVRNWARGVAL